MPQPAGRHRAPRQSALRNPAVAATATLSAVAVSAAGYAGTGQGVAHAAGELQLSPQGASLEMVNLSSAHQATTARAKAAAARAQAGSERRSALAQRSAAAKANNQQAQQGRQLLQARRVLAESATMESRVEKVSAAPATEALSAVAERSASAVERVSRSASRAEVGGSPKQIARSLAATYGWGAGQFSCLEKLWTKESSWQVTADNPTSSAYGIPQALPGRKMASAGADWRTNPVTQIRWGLGYIESRYGSPCRAWGHSQAVNWY